MKKNNGFLERLLEITALDWLPIILKEEKYFPRNERPTPERRSEIHTQIQDIDNTSLQEVVSYLEEKLNEEESRRTQIESKANQLLGFSAIASGLIVGFVQFYLNFNSLILPFRIGLTTLYFFIGSSLLITIILARRAVTLSAFHSPTVTDVLGLRDWNQTHIKITRCVDLLISLENNRAAINDKGTYVNGAQDWFRNFLYFLLILMIVLAISFSINPFFANEDPPTALPIIILTPTLQSVSPTLTSPPSATIDQKLTGTPTITATNQLTVTLPPVP